MQVSDYVKDKIRKLPKGYVFTYDDFVNEVNGKEAVIKSLNRLVESGQIGKLAKGKFYKPEQSPFGQLLPGERQVVKDLLEKNGKIIGYLTGYNVYNRLGLTTQVGSVIQIGSANVRPAIQRGNNKIVFVRQKNNLTKGNIPLLQLLDAIKSIKKIPDAPVANSCKRFVAIIKKLSPESAVLMMRLSMKYPPSTRALVGSFVNLAQSKIDTNKLFKSLNPITIYKVGVTADVLPNANQWNIV